MDFLGQEEKEYLTVKYTASDYLMQLQSFFSPRAFAARATLPIEEGLRIAVASEIKFQEQNLMKNFKDVH